MRSFHQDDNAFIAIGGPAHGKLLQHYGSRETRLYVPTNPAGIYDVVNPPEMLEQVRYDTYELRAFAVGPRWMRYFVHKGLSSRDAERLIKEFENEGEEPEVGRI